MSGMRPNIYEDLPLKTRGVSFLVIATVVGVLLGILLLVAAIYLVYRCFFRESPETEATQKENSHLHSGAGQTGPFYFDPSDKKMEDKWRYAFGNIMCEGDKRVCNAEVVHAALHLPFDLRLVDPLVNEELFADEGRLLRARHRRSSLNHIFGEYGSNASAGPLHARHYDPTDSSGSGAQSAARRRWSSRST